MLVATLGLASTTRAQIADTFDMNAARQVTLSPSTPQAPDPAGVSARLRLLHGVTAAGYGETSKPLPVLATTRTGNLPSTSDATAGTPPGGTEARVVGIENGYQQACQITVTDGRGIDTGQIERASPEARPPGSTADRSRSRSEAPPAHSPDWPDPA